MQLDLNAAMYACSDHCFTTANFCMSAKYN